jgi:hypothetical protein
MCRLFTDRINRCTGRDNGCCGQCACVTNLEQPRFRSCRMITNNGDIGNLHEELHEHGRGTASMHTVTGHCGNTRSHKVAYKLHIVTMQGCSGHCGNLEVGQASYHRHMQLTHRIISDDQQRRSLSSSRYRDCGIMTTSCLCTVSI